MPRELHEAWKAHHLRWRRFAEANIRAMERGKGIRLGPSAKPLLAPGLKVDGEPILKVILCSPHPDDEALTGTLPLRLRQECGAQVTNFAITLGSSRGHRARRRRELKAACQVLGFNCAVVSPPGGFDHVNFENRKDRPREWQDKVRVLSEALEREGPDVVFAPHVEDFHSTHIGTHFLVLDAVRDYQKRTGRGPLPLVETEFWRQHACPNLLVGISSADEATLIMAIAEHGGEVRRNPYHLRHPGRMIDNVRRGAEVVHGQGGAAPDFPFGELYRVIYVTQKGCGAPRPGGLVIAPGEKIGWHKLISTFWPEDLG